MNIYRKITSFVMAIIMLTAFAIPAFSAEFDSAEPNKAKIETHSTFIPDEHLFDDDIHDEHDEQTHEHEHEDYTKFLADTDNLTTDSPDEPESNSVIWKNDKLIKSKGDEVSRAEWLHNLTVIFDMTVAENNAPDNYFSDISSDDDYYKDVLLAVEFGLIDIPAGGEVKPNDPATREFAADTLNYCLGFTYDGDSYTYYDVGLLANPDNAQIAVNRGWFELSEGNFMPDASVTPDEADFIYTDTQTVLTEREIDYDAEDTFTFADGIKVIPEGTAVSYRYVCFLSLLKTLLYNYS